MSQLCSAPVQIDGKNWSGPVVLKNGQGLETLLTNADNAFILIWASWCPHCTSYHPVHKSIAHLFHETYHKAKGYCMAIVVAEIEAGDKERSEEVHSVLDKHRIEMEGFPTMLMKRGRDKVIEKYHGMRDKSQILETLAKFFKDPTLQPDSCYLGDVMPTLDKIDDPAYILLYRRSEVWTPRTSTLAVTKHKKMSVAQEEGMMGKVCRRLQVSADARDEGVAIALDDPKTKLPEHIQTLLNENPNLTLPVLITRTNQVYSGAKVLTFLDRYAETKTL